MAEETSSTKTLAMEEGSIPPSGSASVIDDDGPDEVRATNELPPPYPESETDGANTVAEEKEEKPDPWKVIEGKDDTTPWKDLTIPWKIWRVLWILIRVCLVLGLIYSFICSLDILQESFQLLAGRAAASVFANNVLINNPVSALMIGVLVTVLVQSSSTSTSIVVGMVGSGLLTVPQAIPIVMGANIGTTVTATLVALTQSMNRDTFRRAFASATVHDSFNWLTVLILLPIEVTTHYLFYLTDAIVRNIGQPSADMENPQFLKAITVPFTKLIVEIDKKVISAIAEQTDRQKFPLAKYYCKENTLKHVETYVDENEASNRFAEVESEMFSYDLKLTSTEINGTVNATVLSYTEVMNNSTKCTHLLVGVGTSGYLSEPAAGGIMLICTLLTMTICLVLLVKILNSLLRGPMASIIRKVVNADFPGFGRYFTGYVAILVGAGITILFQSSSVFTSTLTPLVGIGVITIERAYPLTLGSNIGTTVTSLLAALAGDASKIRYTLQISLCHLFFNISGILIFYPVPFMRKVPISIAKLLGNTTAKYRWFAIVYLILMFFCFPMIVFGLSMAGWYVLLAVGAPFLILVAFIVVVNILQNKKPNWLHPKFLRSWVFLPKPCHSLEPYDRVLTVCCRCQSCRKCCCCSEMTPGDTPSSLSTEDVSTAEMEEGHNHRWNEDIYKNESELNERNLNAAVNAAFELESESNSKL